MRGCSVYTTRTAEGLAIWFYPNLLCQIIIKAGMGLTAGYNLFLAPCSRHCWDKRRRFDGPWCRIEQWKRQVWYLMSYLRSSIVPHFLLFLSFICGLYRYLRFKSAETKRINEGDYAAIPSYVKLMWTWRKHSAYHAGIGASASGMEMEMEMRDANIRGWLALSCSFAHYPGISLCSRGVRFVFHLAQPKNITRITSRTRDFRYI